MVLTPRAPGRIDLDHGPVSLRVSARAGGLPHTAAARAAADAAVESLTLLAPLTRVAFRPALSLPDDERWPPVLRLMVEAARRTGDPTLTPMSSVAGSIAEVSVQAGLAAGAKTVVVDNGGDVALAVEAGDSVRVGIARSLLDRTIGHTVTISGPADVGGICTSGFGGRSFTRGVADAAVVLASSASQADACATLLGNAAFVDAPSIEQVPAGRLDPNTDIPDLLVTVRAGILSEAAVCQALLSAQEEARALLAHGLIKAALVTVRGTTVIAPEGEETLFEPVRKEP